MPSPLGVREAAVQAQAVPKLGIGLAYQPQLRPFMETRGAAFDFIEVVPEVVWNDLGPGRTPRYVDDPEARAFLDAQARTRPILPHSIGLSIGSAHRFDREHLAQMARWHEWLRFPWHSDHLAFHLAEGDGVEVNLNLTMPLSLDGETLELVLVARRGGAGARGRPVPAREQRLLLRDVRAGLRRGGIPERAAPRDGLRHPARPAQPLRERHQPGLERDRFLDRLNLDAVVEVHVAGGMQFDGFYLDAHSGPTPRAVWSLLDAVLPRCRNLGGVVFELFGTWYGKLGEEGLLRQLGRMQERWARHQPQPERSVA